MPAYGLLPRDVFIGVEQRTPGNLDPDEWAILRRVIDLIQVNAKGAELGPVLETIENALRADQARLIERTSGAAGGGFQGEADDPMPTPIHFEGDRGRTGFNAHVPAWFPLKGG